MLGPRFLVTVLFVVCSLGLNDVSHAYAQRNPGRVHQGFSARKHEACRIVQLDLTRPRGAARSLLVIVVDTRSAPGFPIVIRGPISARSGAHLEAKIFLPRRPHGLQHLRNYLLTEMKSHVSKGKFTLFLHVAYTLRKSQAGVLAVTVRSACASLTKTAPVVISASRR